MIFISVFISLFNIFSSFKKKYAVLFTDNIWLEPVASALRVFATTGNLESVHISEPPLAQ